MSIFFRWELVVQILQDEIQESLSEGSQYSRNWYIPNMLSAFLLVIHGIKTSLLSNILSPSNVPCMYRDRYQPPRSATNPNSQGSPSMCFWGRHLSFGSLVVLLQSNSKGRRVARPTTALWRWGTWPREVHNFVTNSAPPGRLGVSHSNTSSVVERVSWCWRWRRLRIVQIWGS